MRGLIVSVYRCADGTDCSNRGISSKFSRLIIVGPGIPEIFEDIRVPAIRYVPDHGYGPYCVPMDAIVPNHPKALYGIGQYMFGGNFVYSCDSRFPSRQPIRIHDRCE